MEQRYSGVWTVCLQPLSIPVNALVKSTESAPHSSLPNMFKFLPVKKTRRTQLENVRESIRQKLMLESIIPVACILEHPE